MLYGFAPPPASGTVIAINPGRKEVDKMAYLIIAIVYLVLGAVVVAKTA